MRVAILLLLIGCSKSADTSKPSATDPCSPAALKLPTAKPATVWQLPAGCTVKASAPTTLVKSEADVGAALECTAPHGIDFAKSSLVIVQTTLSPATVGIDALDDGKTVTLVSRQRSPCPDDPRPMPVPATRLFLVDAGDRAFAETYCTFQPSCK